MGGNTLPFSIRKVKYEVKIKSSKFDKNCNVDSLSTSSIVLTSEVFLLYPF